MYRHSDTAIIMGNYPIRKIMKILLQRDSRLFHYCETFGSTDTFSDNLELDAPFTVNEIEPVGSVACVLYSADKIKSAETGKDYDHTWLQTQAVAKGLMTSNGMSPKDGFALAIKGQKVISTGEIDTSPAYFRTDMGDSDYFTNVKSAIQMEYGKGNKRPVASATYWYSEWANVTILPVGKTKISGHCWLIVGWDEAHPNCFKIDSHEGYYKYIPQDVFNLAMRTTYGSIALTIADTTDEQIAILKSIQTSIVQEYLDIIYNIYQQLAATLAQLYGSIFKTN